VHTNAFDIDITAIAFELTARREDEEIAIAIDDKVVCDVLGLNLSGMEARNWLH